MTDRLKQMYSLQYDSQKLLEELFPGAACISGMEEQEQEEKFIKMLMLMIKEGTEVLDEINYKPHIYNNKTIDRDALLEELIDVLKYWFNLCILFGFTDAEIFEKFKSKTDKIITKFEQQAKLRDENV